MFRLADSTCHPQSCNFGVLALCQSEVRLFLSLFLFLFGFFFSKVCFFPHSVQFHQYDGNPSPVTPGFPPFSNYPVLLSPIRISQTSSKADCEELVVGALIQSSSLTTIQQIHNTVAWESRITCFCVCVAFLLLTVKCNLLVSIANSMICSDIWHKYHE